MIGGGPCPMHGGAAPQVNAARLARIVVAEALAKSAPIEGRDLGDVLVSAVQDSDAMAQRIKALIEKGGEELKPSELRAYGEWLDRAGRLSKSALDAQIDQRKVRVTELQHHQFTEILKAVLVALGHDPDSAEVIELVRSCSGAISEGRRPPALAAVRSEVVVVAEDA